VHQGLHATSFVDAFMGRPANIVLFLDGTKADFLQLRLWHLVLNRCLSRKSRKFPVTDFSSIGWRCLQAQFSLLQWSKFDGATIYPMRQESLQIEPGLRWYAMQTKPNKEKEVEKRLSDLTLEVFLPWMRTRRRVGTRFHWILAPLFPSYLFCRMDIVISGKAARYSPGVKDFLTFGNRIAEVDGEIIQALRERCPGGVAQIEPIKPKPGDMVRINEGPFSGLEAVFEHSLKGSERVAVLLEILGRQTRLVLPGETISKV
jgi:transcriptional antiterminator RfaH